MYQYFKRQILIHVIRQVRSDMDFGPVVKPLGITVKNEVGKVVETSVVVRSQATREFWKKGQEPPEPKKGGPKEFSKFGDFQKFVAWCLRRCWFYCLFWRQNVVAERNVKCTQYRYLKDKY